MQNVLQLPEKLYGFAVIPRIGGCGLKLLYIHFDMVCQGHPPHRGMWIEIYT